MSTPRAGIERTSISMRTSEFEWIRVLYGPCNGRFLFTKPFSVICVRKRVHGAFVRPFETFSEMSKRCTAPVGGDSDGEQIGNGYCSCKERFLAGIERRSDVSVCAKHKAKTTSRGRGKFPSGNLSVTDSCVKMYCQSLHQKNPDRSPGIPVMWAFALRFLLCLSRGTLLRLPSRLGEGLP